MTATENKPGIDDLIRYQQQLCENYQPNPVVYIIAKAILATLIDYKRITEAVMPEEPVAVMYAVKTQACEFGCGTMKHCMCGYAEDLVDYADTLRAVAMKNAGDAEIGRAVKAAADLENVAPELMVSVIRGEYQAAAIDRARSQP